MPVIKGGLYRSGDTEIDTVRGIIRRNGEETFLRAKTQLLLQCLIDNRDSPPVSKEELLRQVWDSASVSDATIFGCIQELRKALGDDAREPAFIRTMAKKGYWFVAPVEMVQIDEPEAVAPAEVPEPPPQPPAAKPRRWLYGLLLLPAAAGLLLIASLRHPAPSPEPDYHYEEVAWWKLAEGSGSEIRDSIGNLTGKVPSGVTWGPGVWGNALRFDGNSAFVTGGDGGTLPKGPAARSLSVWINTNNTNADSTLVFGQGDLRPEAGAESFGLFLWGNGRAALWSGPTHPVLGPRVDDGKWHHLALVYDGVPGRLAHLYVDGIPSGETVLPEIKNLQQQDSAAGRAWAIGGLRAGGTSFRGSIGDIRVYDRPLTAPEVFALHRCAAGTAVDVSDNQNRSYYFAPVLGNTVEITPAGPGEVSSRVRNTGNDVAGIDFVERRDDCAVQSLRGATFGQDLRITLDLKIGGSAGDVIGEGGPYFRSRKSAPGDGIIGGTSAGYWVQLQTDGRVRVQRLHPYAVVAFTRPIEGFDANEFHRLSAEAVGEVLRVTLDGKVLTFDQGGNSVREVSIPAVWETSDPRGSNRGTVGVAFACYLNRGKLSGQEARNIRVDQLSRGKQ